MKRLILPIVCVFGIALSSFTSKKEESLKSTKSETSIKYLSNNKISDEDIEFLMEIEGNEIFSTIKILKTKLSTNSVDEAVTKDTADDCGCPDNSDSSTIATSSDGGGEDPGDPSPVDPGYKITQLINKYNNK